jgi:predicted ATP-grasp superfamily ATP-dependent carboligase
VLTTLDRRLRGSPAAAQIAERSRVTWIESPDQERCVFQELARTAEANLAIAPETAGRLLERRQLTDAAGGRFLGPSPQAITLCGDKLRLFEHLSRHGLPTLPTMRCDFSAGRTDYRFPIVVKPRDGAGSIKTYLIRDREGLERRRDELNASFAVGGHEPIVQPFVDGRSLSTAALIDPETDHIEVFPLGEQRLSCDDRIQYRGGRIPAHDVSAQLGREAVELVTNVCRSLPGLAGFIGFDLIVSANSPRVQIVEINPRLTTSYVGYRRLTSDNLAARMLDAKASPEPIQWSCGVRWDKLAQRAPAHHLRASTDGGPAAGGPALSHPTNLRSVEFDADGTIRVG